MVWALLFLRMCNQTQGVPTLQGVLPITKVIYQGKLRAVIVVNPATNKVLDATYWHTNDGNESTRMSKSFAQRYIDLYGSMKSTRDELFPSSS